MAVNARVGRAVLEIATDSATYDTTIARAKADAKELGRTWQQTQTQLQGMQSSLQAHAARIASFVKDFSGDRVVQQAHQIAAAVQQVGGASKLTETEQAQVNRTVAEAIAKYAALGRTAPKALIDLEVATRRVVQVSRSLGQGGNAVFQQIGRLTQSFQGREIIGEASRIVAAVQRVGGATRLTASEQARVNATVTEAIAKYRALGMQAPSAMIALEHATRRVEPPTSFLTTKMVALGAAVGTFVGQLASQLAYRAGRTLLELGRNAFTSASQILDLKNKTTESTASIQRMQSVANLTGTSIETMADAAFMLRTRLAGGSNTVVAALRDLIAASGQAGLTTRSSADQILSALSQVSDSQERIRLGNALFGRSYKELAASVTEGYADIAKAAKISSDAQIEALDRAADRWTQFVTNTETSARSATGNIVLFFDAIREVLEEGGVFQLTPRVIDEAQRRVQLGLVGARRTDIQLKAAQTRAEETYTQQLAKVRAELARLTAAQLAEIAAAQKLGVTADDLELKFHLTAGAIGVLNEQQREATRLNERATTWIENNKLALTRLDGALRDAKQAGVPMNAVIKEFGTEIDDAVLKARIFHQTVPPAVMDAAAAMGRLADEINRVPPLDFSEMAGLRAVPDAVQTWQRVFDAIDQRQQQSLQRRQQGILEARQFEIDFARSRGTNDRQLFLLTERLERSRLDVELGAEQARYEIQLRGVDRTSELYRQLERAHQDTVNHLNAQWEIGVERRRLLFQTDAQKLVQSIRGQVGELGRATFGSLATIFLGDRGGNTRAARAEVERLEASYQRLKDSGTASAEALTRAFREWQEAVDRQNEQMVSRWESVWMNVKRITLSILDDIGSYFLKQFIGGLLRGIAGARIGQALGNALTGGLTGAAIGGGAAAVAGGASFAAAEVAGVESAALAAAGGGGGAAAGAGAGGLGSTLAGLATNPITWAVAGGVLLGWGIVKKGWFRGGEEALQVNPRRDRFLAQLGPPGTGPGSGFGRLAAQLTEWSGVGGGGPLFRALTTADTMKEYRPAEAAIIAEYAKHGRRLQSFHVGGVIDQRDQDRRAPMPWWRPLASGERLIVALKGEAVLTQRATQAIGGKATIDALNAGRLSPLREPAISGQRPTVLTTAAAAMETTPRGIGRVGIFHQGGIIGTPITMPASIHVGRRALAVPLDRAESSTSQAPIEVVNNYFTIPGVIDSGTFEDLLRTYGVRALKQWMTLDIDGLGTAVAAAAAMRR